MDMDLDALLLQEDSEDESLVWTSSMTDEETKSDVTWSPSPSSPSSPSPLSSPSSRPESPCSVEVVLPLPPPLPRTKRRNETHRVRHRESMARYRQEKRERVDALTTQQTALQRILLQVLAHKKPVVGESSDHTSLQRFQAQFTELVRARETLEIEQRKLLDSVVGHSQRFGSLQIMLDHMNANATEPHGVRDDDLEHDIEARFRRLLRHKGHDDAELVSDRVDAVARKPGHWLEFLRHEPRLFYELESPASCGAIIRAGLASLQDIHDSLSDPRLTGLCVASCLGWRAEQVRKVEATTGRPKLLMRFTKRIPRAMTTIQELQHKTWHFLNSPELIARVNNGAVTAHVAQQLSDDAIVLLRNSPDKFGHKRFRYFSLNARLWSTTDVDPHGDGGTASVRVLMLVLDKEAALETPLDTSDEKQRPPLRWMKHGGSSLRFAYAVDDVDAIEIQYTGFIESATNEHAAHLLVANASALLRWEHLVVPPRLLL